MCKCTWHAYQHVHMHMRSFLMMCYSKVCSVNFLYHAQWAPDDSNLYCKMVADVMCIARQNCDWDTSRTVFHDVSHHCMLMSSAYAYPFRGMPLLQACCCCCPISAHSCWASLLARLRRTPRYPVTFELIHDMIVANMQKSALMPTAHNIIMGIPRIQA